MKKAIILTICLTMAGILFAAATERLVIVDLDAMDRDSGNITKLLNTRDLNALFAKDDHFIIIIGKEVNNALKGLGITSPKNSLSSAEVAAIGEKLDASIVVWGGIQKIDNTNFRMTGNMRSQRTGTFNQFSLQISNDRNQRQVALRRDFHARLTEFSKGEMDKLFDVALQQFNSGALENAESQFLNIARIDPRNIEVYRYLGFIQLQVQAQLTSEERDYTKAIEYYNQGLKIDPNHEDLLRNISEAYKQQAMIDEAIQALEKLAQIKADPLIYHSIALMYYRDKKEVAEALAALDKGLALDDTNEHCMTLYSEITYDNQRFHEAIPYLESLVDLRPENDDFARRLAISYQRTGQLNKAIEKYQSILAADRNNVRAWQNLAAAYRTMAIDSQGSASRENNRLALNAFQEALKIAPANAQARIEVSIADTYNSLNELTNAERFANAARQKQANLFEASIILGDIAQKRGIEAYNTYVDLQTLTDRGNLFGRELDDAIARRDRTRADAHARFNAADRNFREALESADSDRVQSEIRSRIQANRQLIENTRPDNF